MGKSVTMSFNGKNLQHINMISAPLLIRAYETDGLPSASAAELLVADCWVQVFCILSQIKVRKIYRQVIDMTNIFDSYF